jgi:steroid 5-alpha reductase family enzyme
VLRAAPAASPIADAGLAMGASSVVVYAFSVALRNASCFDPWWSVAPMGLVAWWVVSGASAGGAVSDAAAGGNRARQLFVLALVMLWGARLTWNWIRGWGGLHHEDWRYVHLREITGRLYPLTSLFGIHLFPTLMVWLGCISAWLAIKSPAPLGALDGVAGAVTLGAVAIEAVADAELHAARSAKDAKVTGGSPVNERGLWALSRHPNYFGEISFWWGLFGFAIAADRANLWAIIGPLAMTAMFVFATIPLMEKRQLKRKPAYADYVRRVSMLVPWPPRRDADDR